MGRTQELNGLKSVIGCHLNHKSVREIFNLPDLPWSTLSAINVKWMHLWVAVAQLGSSRPHRAVAHGTYMLSILCFITCCKRPQQVTSAQELCIRPFMKWVFMVKQLHLSLGSPCAMHTNFDLGLSDGQKILPTRMDSVYCTFWWKKDNRAVFLFLFFLE